MGNRKGIEGLVTELDPDAPNRTDGKKSLAADDAVSFNCASNSTESHRIVSFMTEL